MACFTDALLPLPCSLPLSSAARLRLCLWVPGLVMPEPARQRPEEATVRADGLASASTSRTARLKEAGGDPKLWPSQDTTDRLMPGLSFPIQKNKRAGLAAPQGSPS